MVKKHNCDTCNDEVCRAPSFVERNLPWVVSTLVAIGIFAGSVKYYQVQIDKLDRNVSICNDDINALKITSSKLIKLESDIAEIKSDVRDIRKVIYKPIYEVKSGDKVARIDE